MGKYFNAKNQVNLSLKARVGGQAASVNNGKSSYPCLRALAFLAVLGLSVCFGNSAYADAPTISLSTSSASNDGLIELSDLAPTSTSGAYTSGSDTLSINTTCFSGYKVYVSATSDNRYGTNLVNTADNAATIATTSSAIGSEASISSNSVSSWGIRLGSGNTFAGLPAYADATKKEIYAGTDLTKSIDIYYGINVISSTAPGTYEGKVLYTVMMNKACTTYTVKYDKNANDATGTMNNQTIEAGAYSVETIKLTKNAFSRAGYTFLGWSTNKSALAATYTDEYTLASDLAEATGEVTLYAIWKANTVTVSFNANGGLGTTMASQIFTYNTAQNLSANTYTRSGYTFKGWATSSGGSIAFTDKQSTTAYALNSAVNTGNQARTLYAVWEEAVADNSLTFAEAGLTSGVSYMQAMTTNICTKVKIGQITTLIDSRDNTGYRVKKLADGKCWMVDNLLLGAKTTAGYNLTSADTNLTTISSFFLPPAGRQGTSASNLSAVTFSSANDNQARVSYRTAGTSSSWGTTLSYNMTYYNFYAATAGYSYYQNSGSGEGVSYGTSPNDICPKGWRLAKVPTSGTDGGAVSSNGTDNDYAYLADSYGATGWSTSGVMRTAGNTSAAFVGMTGDVTNTAQGYAGYYLAGHIQKNSDTLWNVGENGQYWTSSIISGTKAHTFAYNKNTIYINNLNYEKYEGLTIRCLAK